MIPPPYLIQITCGRPNTVLNGRIRIRDAHFDGVDQCLHVACRCILQRIFGVPQRTDLEKVIAKAYFEVEHTLAHRGQPLHLVNKMGIPLTLSLESSDDWDRELVLKRSELGLEMAVD